MKKVFITLLVFSLCLLLSACSSSTTDVEVTEDTESTTTSLAEELIGSWNNTTEEDGNDSLSFTYTFKDDDSVDLEIVSSYPQSEENGAATSSTKNISGTYTLDGDTLTLNLNVSVDSTTSDEAETTAEALAEDVETSSESYTITIENNELTMTDSSGDSYVYTRVS